MSASLHNFNPAGIYFSVLPVIPQDVHSLPCTSSRLTYNWACLFPQYCANTRYHFLGINCLGKYINWLLPSCCEHQSTVMTNVNLFLSWRLNSEMRHFHKHRRTDRVPFSFSLVIVNCCVRLVINADITHRLLPNGITQSPHETRSIGNHIPRHRHHVMEA